MTHHAMTRPRRGMASALAAVLATAAGIVALLAARSELPQLRRYLRIKRM